MSVINREVTKATNEKLQRPDASLNSTLCDFVNKHPDKSELVANAIKERILENNTKVQMLAFFLLDTLMKKCGFPFHSQVGAKPFMNVIIQLLNNKDVSQQVKKKILQLIQHWGLRFEEDADVLPLFSSVYGALKTRSLPFPDEDEARQQIRKLKDALDGKAPMPESKPLDKKHAKLRKDLEVVIQNVVLTNEMIDAHDPSEEVEENDALISLAQTLKTFENKIMEIIEKIKNDEVMHLALLTNDDLQKTLKRYKKVEHGRSPDAFKPECRKYLPGYRDTPEKPKEKPAKKIDAPQPVAQPVGTSKPAPVQMKAPSATEDDIFGLSDPTPTQSFGAKPAAQKQPSTSEDDIFGLDFGASSSSSTQQTSDSINKLNEIMERMNLEKQEQAKAPMFATAAPGMGGGFGGPPPMGGFGGPPMGGGFNNFGPSPGMFNTGMPPPNTFGGSGGMFGPGNFSTSYNQPPPSSFGGPGFGGPGFGGGAGGFGGPGFGGPGPMPSADPFAGSGKGSIFNTAAPNYNKGGGPEAFKGKIKPKKVDKGPKEFNDLFSMASKISDRTNQPNNRVDDYVTSYKQGFDQPGGSDNFGMGGGQSQSAEDDFFGGGAAQPSYGAPSMQKQPSDPFGGMSDMYGGSNNQPSSSTQYDAFGGDQNQFDAFGAGQQNQPSSNGGGMFGGGASQGQPDNKTKQDELFDIFG